MEASAKSQEAARWTRAAGPAAPAVGGREIGARWTEGVEPEVVELVGIRTTSDRLRRGVNVTMASLALIVAAPLMLVIAALVKLTSSGPVLYTQPRVGRDRRNGTGWWETGDGRGEGGDGAAVGEVEVRDEGAAAPSRAGGSSFLDDPAGGNGDAPGGNGDAPHGNADAPGGNGDPHLDAAPRGNGERPARGDGRRPPSPVPDPRSRDRGGRVFTIYKFRTMYTGADDGEAVWASPDDDRVTPVGRVLRKLHLDELPQLFNVLRGDMNLVGPRPEQPEIFTRMARRIPGYRVRQKVRPGITGWAQVNHHYDRNLEDVRKKVDLDLQYLERRSPLEDVRIAVLTVPAVLLDGRAEGW